ncbi:outer membrane protein assembly factor BamD [bacterium]|nr:outer membrane protein assembly factor BamD [bacterium]
MRNYKYLIMGILGLLALNLFTLSCSRRIKVYQDPHIAYEQAYSAYERGKYTKAIEILEKFVFDFPGTELIDDAHMLLGRSYYRSKQYILAVGEFKRVLDSFGESEYSEEAEYMVGLCYYKESPRSELDQEYTMRAISWLKDFAEYYPDSPFYTQADSIIFLCQEKLALKEYKNLELYYNLRKYEAALLYGNLLIEEYSNSEWICPAYLIMIQAHQKLENITEARELIKTLLENCSQAQILEKANQISKELSP